MPFDLSLLTFNHMIFHDIPLPSPGTSIELTEVETDVDDELRNFVRLKLTKGLVKSGFDIAFDENVGNQTRDAVNQMIRQRESNFVSLSGSLASHLYASQNNSMSLGLLMVATTTNRGKPGVALVKIERDEGVSINPTTLEGRRTFTVQHLKNLMFTDRTRLYKIAYFEGNSDELEDPLGTHADLQRSWSSRNQGHSDFFLRRFLGCKPTETPALSNQRYFDAGEGFFNSIENPELRGRYLMSFQADFQSHRGTLNPSEFIADHVDLQDRQSFTAHLVESGIDPSQSIMKDTALVKNKIRKAKWDFESGIVLMGTQEAFDDHVETESLSSGDLKTTIVDRLKQVHGN